MSCGLTNLAEVARFGRLAGRAIAVLGCGAQGVAHAENLRDSGAIVRVGQRVGGAGERRAREAGFEADAVSSVVPGADLIVFALPDDATPAVYASEVRPALRAGQTLGFLHGFIVHYELIEIPPHVDVVLCAPKGQGRAVREQFAAGGGVGALIAVHQDATGRARDTALAWAAGIGSHRTAIFETTFRDETETDLFGEQAVLCGGVSALVRAGYETLVEAGYPAELAYMECCHELKLVVDLIYAEGIAGMRSRISSTARYGDLTRGPRIIDESVRARMREILGEIRSGQFAREFVAAAREANGDLATGSGDGVDEEPLPNGRGSERRGRASERRGRGSEKSDAFEEVGRALRELLLRRGVE